MNATIYHPGDLPEQTWTLTDEDVINVQDIIKALPPAPLWARCWFGGNRSIHLEPFRTNGYFPRVAVSGTLIMVEQVLNVRFYRDDERILEKLLLGMHARSHPSTLVTNLSTLAHECNL